VDHAQYLLLPKDNLFFWRFRQPPAFHLSQDGIVDEKVQVVIEPERMTVSELKV